MLQGVSPLTLSCFFLFCFSQLDAHLLKAVAIENSRDVDAAVEVVLSEILPYMTENATPPSCLPGNLFSQSHADEEGSGTVSFHSLFLLMFLHAN